MQSTNKQEFCSRPFEWLEVHKKSSGRLAYLCCSGWVNYPGINMEGKSLQEVWNGPQAQEFRASILDGSFRYCNLTECIFRNQRKVPCWDKEGVPLKNKEDIQSGHLHHIISNRLTYLEQGPLTLNIATDPTCNLSCLTCRKSLLALNHEEVAEEYEFQKKLLSSLKGQLQTLYLAGNGDPFASSTIRKLLKELSSSEYSDLEVHLHTNGLLWSARNWETLNSVNKIKTAHISIDAATAKTYETNRRGGQWSILMKNLEFVSKLRRNGSLRFVTVSFVVQVNNYQEMPAFIDMARKMSFDLVQFHKVGNWGSFSDDEFRRIAIHHPAHPEHYKFMQVLTNDCFADPIVGLFCLTELRQKALKLRRGLLGFWPPRIIGILYRIFLSFLLFPQGVKRKVKSIISSSGVSQSL